MSGIGGILGDFPLRGTSSIVPNRIPSDPKDGGQVWKIFTGPSVEPITLSEVKLFGRIDGTTEDTMITNFIQSVREATENHLGRALIQQKMILTLDYWPGLVVELPKPPLISVEEIDIVDESGVSVIYTSDNYFVVTDSIPGKIVIKSGTTPPLNSYRTTAGFKINYTAGYGPATTDVPRIIRDAMLLWVMQIYENRTLTPEPPPEASVMMSGFRVIRY